MDNEKCPIIEIDVEIITQHPYSVSLGAGASSWPPDLPRSDYLVETPQYFYWAYADIWKVVRVERETGVEAVADVTNNPTVTYEFNEDFVKELVYA